MANEFKLAAVKRDDKGKGASRRLRRLQGMVPAIVYGGKGEPVSIMLKHNEFMHATENEAFYSHILNLEIDGKSEQVVLKDMQRHPYKPVIQHADFMRIVKGQVIHVNVPLHFVNEDKAFGVREEGGVISRQVTEVEVIVLPADLPEYIEVDVKDLKLDEILHLSDIKLPEGVKLTQLEKGEDHDQSMISIHKPRVVKVEGDDDEVTEDGADDDTE